MIRPGWKRDVCPQCHMPGRVGERFQAALRARKPEPGLLIFTYPNATFRVMELSSRDLRVKVHLDICDNCGAFYAYEAVEYPRQTQTGDKKEFSEPTTTVPTGTQPPAVERAD